MNNTHKRTELGYRVSRDIFLFSVFLSIFSFFDFGNVSYYTNLAFFSFFSGAVFVFFTFMKRDQHRQNSLWYFVGFIVYLLIGSLNSIEKLIREFDALDRVLTPFIRAITPSDLLLYFVIALIFGALFFVLNIHRVHLFPRTTEKDIPKSHKILIYITLIAAAIGGFFLRVNNLGAPSMWQDELVIFEAAENFLEGRGLVLDSGAPYANTPVSTIFVILSFMFLEPSEFSARLPFVILGVLLIFINFFVVRKVTGNYYVALLTSLAITTSLWIINYSREIRMYTLNMIFMYLIIYFLYRFLNSKRERNLVVAFILVFFAILNHRLMLLVVPPLALIILYHYRSRLFKFKIWHYVLMCIPFIAFLFIFQEPIFYFVFNPSTYGFWTQNTFFYFDLFLDKFFIVTVLYALGLFIMPFIRDERYYLTFLFMPLIVWMTVTFLISAKTERYIIFIFPIMVTVAVYLFDHLMNIVTDNRVTTFFITAFAVLLLITPVYDGFQVGENKISFDSRLQKNKYSWREAVDYFNDNITVREGDLVVTGNGIITNHYGLESDYGVWRRLAKRNESNLSADFYSGLGFLANKEEFRGYMVIDKNNYKNAEYRDFLEEKKSRREYYSEGIYIFRLD